MRFTSPRNRATSRHSQQQKTYRFSTSSSARQLDDSLSSSCSTTSTAISSSSSSSGSSNRNSKKKVRFRVSQFTYVEPSPLTLSTIRKSDLYYTKEELEDICLENRAILRCMQRDAYCCVWCDDDMSSPTRGLEDRTWEGSCRRFWNQRNACKAVLQEQERQRKGDIYEPEAMAKIYSFFSKRCKTEAKIIGTKDAGVAKKAASS